ncbi:MAG: hypothetical protein JHC74_00900, partial [Thermoleophilia bacterium]|nr:hypothetical protein [Thermoleophilia bacterium]
MLTRATSGPLAIALLLAIAVTLGGATPRAEAACIFTATHLGQTYYGMAAPVPDDDIGRVSGRATIPPCNDTPLSGTVETETVVSVRRVHGIAPRFAVVIAPGGSIGSTLLVAEGDPCSRSTSPGLLECLRERTRRLVEGPSLIAPTSAAAGALIPLAVRVRDPALRRASVFGVEARLQRLTARRWISVFHLSHPLPGDAAPPEPVAVGTPGVAGQRVGQV